MDSRRENGTMAEKKAKTTTTKTYAKMEAEIIRLIDACETLKDKKVADALRSARETIVKKAA